MKLSEVVFEGCTGTVQGYGKMMVDDGEVFVCCALGAAYVGLVRRGLAHLDNARPYGCLCHMFPELDAPPPNDVPEKGYKGDSLLDVIVFLNDTCKWTRERIAEYLQSLGY